MKKTKRPIDHVRRHPRWGATKAQGQRYARERDLANRIHELEQQLAHATQPTGVIPTISEQIAIRTIVGLPFSQVHAMDLVEEVKLLSCLERKFRLASGKVAA